MESCKKSASSQLDNDKKGYHSPELLVYGNMPELTKAVANNSMTSDGGSMSTQKTS
jgi:hypothetical protein